MNTVVSLCEFIVVIVAVMDISFFSSLFAVDLRVRKMYTHTHTYSRGRSPYVSYNICMLKFISGTMDNCLSMLIMTFSVLLRWMTRTKYNTKTLCGFSNDLPPLYHCCLFVFQLFCRQHTHIHTHKERERGSVLKFNLTSATIVKNVWLFNNFNSCVRHLKRFHIF